jgi:hypothetical protein
MEILEICLCFTAWGDDDNEKDEKREKERLLQRQPPNAQPRPMIMENVKDTKSDKVAKSDQDIGIT